MKWKKWPTVNAMVRAIERRVCVRKLWRCNAGWALSFVLDDAQARAHGVYDLSGYKAERRRAVERPTAGWHSDLRLEYERHGTVFAYYGSIEEAVRAEYLVWVKGEERPPRRSRRTP